MRNTISNSTKPLNLITRESLLRANSELIEQLQDRLKAKRFRPQEGDGIKLAYMRVFIQALQVQNSILKDSELEDLKERLEILEARMKGSRSEKQIYNSGFAEQSEYV